METSEIEDVFAEYGLDWDDPFTEGLVNRVSGAIVKLFDGYKTGKSPSTAFNEFVDAWEFFYFMPEETQAKSKKLMEDCEQMWADVSNTKASEFCEHCAMAVQDGADSATSLCDMCGEMVEAIFALDGRLPEAERIFDAGHGAAMHGKSLPDACKAYLYVLSARIWYKCLGYPCSEEELILSEGIKHHMKAKAQGAALPTGLYAMHMATAIFDASYVRWENGIKREEICELVQEAYSLLDTIDSPTSLKEKDDLYQLTGIPYRNMTNEEYFGETQMYISKNNDLLN